MLGTWKGKVFTRGKKFFELSNHLGNVLVTITDCKQQVPKNDTLLKYYEPDVATANDYYPFGMLQPGRKYSSAGSGYRYGFNGKENDNEVEGEGNTVSFENRVYDSRLGRWLALDPLQRKYPNESNYIFTSDNPVIYADLDGRDKIYVITIIGKDGKSNTIQKTDAGFFIYKKVSVPGFGNNRYYRSDLIVSTTIDLSKNTLTYSEMPSAYRNEIGGGDYNLHRAGVLISKIFGGMDPDETRGSQPGGIYLTSEFKEGDADGPKTDATKGTTDQVNIDLIMAGFASLSISNNIENVAEFADLIKQTTEALIATKEKLKKQEGETTQGSSPSNSPANTKEVPIIPSQTNKKKGPPFKVYSDGTPAPADDNGPQLRLIKTPDEGTKPDTIVVPKPKSKQAVKPKTGSK
ncbi:MAG TPA: RHS repeat-associated core domain-containing protein [Candidatus Brocadiaceae bacterium]